jgi:hypothetical protein
MNEFAHEMTARVDEASTSLAEAHLAGDDYLVEVRLGELESLARVAQDHGLHLPTVADTLARYGRPEDNELPESTLSATGPIQIDLTEDQPTARPA